RCAAHATEGLDCSGDNFRRHRHTSADVRAGGHTVAVRDAGSNLLGQPSGHVEFRYDNMLSMFCSLADFLGWPGPQGFDLYQTATDPFVLEKPDRFTTLRHCRTRRNDDNIVIDIFCVDQAVQPPDRVFAGAVHCRPDFLLPGSVGGIADVVALHDKWIAHHPDRRTFHVHTGHWRAVWIIGRKAHVGRSEVDDVLRVRHKKPIATECQGEMHVWLFRYPVALEDPIDKVLCGFRMPDEHAGVQEV